MLQSLLTEDRLTVELSLLYEKFGFKKYCMAKFEEYSFYSDNRDFLSGEGVIAFNNSDGRLMALKPDITLSIVKNAKLDADTLTKSYYNESVYRIAENTHDYKEIKQTGVEVLGKINIYSVTEIILIALKSLKMIDENFILTLSHMAVVSSLLDNITVSSSLKKKITECVKQKNMHDLRYICEKSGIDKDKTERFIDIVSINGKIDDALAELKKFTSESGILSAYNELKAISDAISSNELKEKIFIDFSVLNHIDYYNGIIFQGYVKNAPSAILSGGRYDNLAGKIRKNTEAVGFAIYLDNLNLWYPNDRQYDIDTVIINKDSNTSSLLSEVNKLINDGVSVRVENCIPKDYKYKTILFFEDGKLKEEEKC